MKKLSVIIKYFPTRDRFSGVTSMMEVLVDRLQQSYELHIFSACDEKTAREWNALHESKLHSVGNYGFWWGVGKAVQDIRPDRSLIVSGIHKSAVVYPVLKPLVVQLSELGPVTLLQSVNLDRNDGVLAKRLYRSVDNLLASNPDLAKQLSTVTYKEVIYLPPAINVSAIETVQATQPTRQFRVGFLNHLNRVKGADLAATAFREASRDDIEFLVAGEGELENQVRHILRDTPAVSFKGRLRNPIEEIKACDIVVLPFRTSVSVLGISQTVLECMAAGTIVIGSHESTICSVIENDRTGIIVDGVEDIAPQIHRTLDDPVKRAELRRNAISYAKRHDVPTVARQLTSLIG